MPKSPVVRSLSWFVMILVAYTLVFGIIAGLLPAFAQQMSYLVLLPYFAAFWTMSKKFVHLNAELPTPHQRWQLSMGAAALFWAYSILAGCLGLWLTGHWASVADQLFSPANQEIVWLWLIMIIWVSTILIGLGYWFLGRPLALLRQS